MMPSFPRKVVIAGCAVLSLGLLHAQRGGNDWVTIGNDAQRSNWLRADGKISVDSMSKPGFAIVWKMKLAAAARQLSSITPPALLDFYIGYRGFRTLGFFGTPNKIIGVDTDLARLEWEHPMAWSPSAGTTVPCPGGVTSSVARPISPAYPRSGGGFGGRGAGAKSAVGAPGAGAVTIRAQPQPQFPQPPPPAATASANARRATPPPNPFGRSPQFIYSVSSDGKLHAMYVSNGEEPKQPIPFIPANSNARGLIVYDSVAYVTTTGGCGGADNGVWALDLESKEVKHWKSNADIAGIMGAAAGPDGTVFVASGSEIVSLEPVTLKHKKTFSAGSATFTSSPVVFEHKGKDLLAATTSDGKLHVIDAGTLTAVASSAEFSSPDFATGALASWQDGAGTRWILAPAGGKTAASLGAAANGAITTGAIVAFKLSDGAGSTSLEPAWVSRNMTSPIAPAIVNGVVFGVSSGEFRPAGGKGAAALRAQRSGKAVLYALDGATGKELWNSGASITSFVTSGGLASGGGRVYVSAWDGTQYAFGFPMEH